jgi:hypothetical protein
VKALVIATSVLHIFRLGTDAGTSTFRFFFRRAASTLRPPGVAMRARKPLTRARFLQQPKT